MNREIFASIVQRVAETTLNDEMGLSSDIDAAVIEFLVANPFPDDDDVHAFAEEQRFDKHETEKVFYRMATYFAQFLNDGRANSDGFKQEDADQKELAMGIEIEKEHTPNPLVAKRIAIDHLAEIPDYYTRLKKMEDEAKSGV